MGLLRGPKELAASLSDAPSLKRILPDTTVYWIGYPFSRKPISARMNLLIQERWNLTMFMFEMIHLFSQEDGAATGERFRRDAEFLSARLASWYRQLPDALVYGSEMPPAFFEFQYGVAA